VPTVPVNLADVSSQFEDLPYDEYEGQIDKVEWRPAREKGKFPQLMVTYTVIDGEQVGRKTSEFLSLSPKADFRLKAWFNKFGLGELETFDYDEDTNQVTEPDLVGIRVVFKVLQDGYKPGTEDPRVRTQLVTVLDELETVAPAEEVQAEPEPEVEEAEAPVRRPVRPAPRSEDAPKRRTLR
jgi:hypothetical protein